MAIHDSVIAVYHDEGTGEFSRGCLVQALTRAFEGRARIRRIFASEICASDAWHEGTRFVAMPGGADAPYAERLNGRGNASILRYLHAGGGFFGVCAGAYYACARISFEPSTLGAITGSRELALFRGTAFGSLHDLAAPYSLDHLHCAEVARVYAPNDASVLRALYWGGPELVPDLGTRYRPLLHYVRGDGRPSLAAVCVEVGRGRAVLTGVHAEVLGSQFPIEVSRYGDDSFDHGMLVARALTAAELERRQTFDLLLAALET
ncbi:MAG TPA: BPL-N domain-containing protein [Polyangiales bacterium]|jgi:glutamine amidotransferase-like uncharacterized protein